MDSVSSSSGLRRRPVSFLPWISAFVLTVVLVSAALAQTGRLKLSKRKGSFYLVGCVSSKGSMKVAWNSAVPNTINGIGTIYSGAVPPMLAQSLSEDCNAARHFFGVNSPMMLMMEEDSPNAAATNIVLSPAANDGTVFLGLKLMNAEFAQTAGYGIPTVIGHEFAHIMQMKRRLPVRETMWREIHADFLAGWFTAVRSRFRPQDVRASAFSIFSKGDMAFNDPGHHGTPNQRLASFMAGAMSMATGQAQTASVAYDKGVAYIKMNGARLMTEEKPNEEAEPAPEQGNEGESEDGAVPYFLRR